MEDHEFFVNNNLLYYTRWWYIVQIYRIVVTSPIYISTSPHCKV